MVLDLVAYFCGGAFLSNAVPHFCAGVMGRSFQTPFAKPRGVGLSSAIINVLWGFFNLVVGYWLLRFVGEFDLKNTADILACGLGVLLMALYCARHFGQFYGGNTP